MGIVQRQGIWNTIWSFLGVGIGYLNKVYLYRVFLLETQYGLIELLLFWMLFGVEISQFGISKIVIRFFPFVHGNPKREHAFLTYVSLYALGGFLLFGLIFYLFQPVLLGWYEGKAPLFVLSAGYLVPLVLIYSLNKLLTALSQSILKSVVPTFTQQVALRAYQTVIILVAIFWDLDFSVLLALYVIGYLVPVILNLAYLIWLGKLNFKWDTSMWGSKLAKILLAYGLYTLLADASVVLVNRLDGIMLGSMLGEASVGAYALAFYLAALIFIPARALNSIGMPLVARHIKRKEMVPLLELYQKTALSNLILGALFLVGIWVNIDSFFLIKDTFSQGRDAAILLGIGICFSVSTGINRAIIINSKHYRFDLYTNIFMLLLILVGNYFLIPILHETGAAITTMLGLLVYNSINSWYVWHKMGIHPFQKATFYALLIIVGVLLVGLQLPKTGSPMLDIVWHSALVGSLYMGLMLGFRISADLNGLIKKLIPWFPIGG